MQTKLRDIVEKYIVLYNSFEIEKMAELFVEDCVFQNISNSSGITQCNGKKELLSLANQSAGIFSSRNQTILNWIVGEDKVAVEIDYAAVLSCDLPNGLKKGETLKLKGVSIYEFESGKIKRLADFS